MSCLACCEPTATYPGSSTVVHGPACAMADIPLMPSEFALWREHPSAPRDEVPLGSPEPDRTRPHRPVIQLARHWDIGLREPDREDFS